MTKKSKGTHLVSLCIDKNFDSFGIECIPQDVLKKSKINPSRTTFRTQSDDSFMYKFCCIAFIE